VPELDFGLNVTWASISFRRSISLLLSKGRERLEFLPTMNHRAGINFGDALEDAFA
jgi:hypothetical protein